MCATCTETLEKVSHKDTKRIVEYEPKKLYSVFIPRIIDKSQQQKLAKFLETYIEEKYPTGEYDIKLGNNRVEWTWKTTRGTFPKRLASYLFKTYQVKLDNKALTEVGNITSSSAAEDKIWIDFYPVKVSTIWKSDLFGENGSCMLKGGGRSGSLKIFEKNGVWALRIFDGRDEKALFERYHLSYADSSFGKFALGRCWFIKQEHKGKNAWIFFNGYKKGGSNGAVDYARIFSHYFGSLPYKKVSLYNEGNTEGLVYINGGTGFVVTDNTYESLSSVTSWDLGLKTKGVSWELDSDDRTCDECGEERSLTQLGDNWYCEDCLSEVSFCCDYCDNRTHNDEAYTVYGRRYQECTVCESCRDNHYIYCETEEQYHSTANVVTINGNSYSIRYADENFKKCPHCSEYFNE